MQRGAPRQDRHHLPPAPRPQAHSADAHAQPAAAAKPGAQPAAQGPPAAPNGLQHMVCAQSLLPLPSAQQCPVKRTCRYQTGHSLWSCAGPWFGNTCHLLGDVVLGQARCSSGMSWKVCHVDKGQVNDVV